MAKRGLWSRRNADTYIPCGLVFVDARGFALLNHGLSLNARQLKPARVEWINDDQFSFVVREERKRQIQRRCELLGLRVSCLKRVRISMVRLADLPLGQTAPMRSMIPVSSITTAATSVARSPIIADSPVVSKSMITR